jgi:hypothetical protein
VLSTLIGAIRVAGDSGIRRYWDIPAELSRAEHGCQSKLVAL